MSGFYTAVAGLALTAYSASEAEDAADVQIQAQRDAQAAQARSASAQAQAERVKAIREARIRQAQLTASGAAGGMGQASSGLAGSISSIGAQTAANIGTINVQEGFAAQISAANARAATAGNKIAEWQGLQQLGMSALNQGISRLGKTGTASTPGGASGGINFGSK